MAVPKKKTSKSRKGMRRSHHRVDIPNVVICECGEASLPHKACPSCGVYKGRQMMTREEAE